eukprot:SAG31_NODE_7099_length_1789_cov_1.333728_2_plen_100_part_00
MNYTKIIIAANFVSEIISTKLRYGVSVRTELFSTEAAWILLPECGEALLKLTEAPRKMDWCVTNRRILAAEVESRRRRRAKCVAQHMAELSVVKETHPR